MSEAHTFQHKYTGVQISVFHVEDELQARSKFSGIVVLPEHWIYLGIKKIIN